MRGSISLRELGNETMQFTWCNAPKLHALFSIAFLFDHSRSRSTIRFFAKQF